MGVCMEELKDLVVSPKDGNWEVTMSQHQRAYLHGSRAKCYTIFNINTGAVSLPL
jgi:hypothetical protein